MEGRRRHSLPDSFTLAVYMQFLVAADSGGKSLVLCQGGTQRNTPLMLLS